MAETIFMIPISFWGCSKSYGITADEECLIKFVKLLQKPDTPLLVAWGDAHRCFNTSEEKLVMFLADNFAIL